jgi:uncharacterized protein DUF1499
MTEGDDQNTLAPNFAWACNLIDVTGALTAQGFLRMSKMYSSIFDVPNASTHDSSWFGFKDDVVVQVTPTDGGSRIDVRSVSRVGLSDVGANAERITTYLARTAGNGG